MFISRFLLGDSCKQRIAKKEDNKNRNTWQQQTI
jgi:hypothetical protein